MNFQRGVTIKSIVVDGQFNKYHHHQQAVAVESSSPHVQSSMYTVRTIVQQPQHRIIQNSGTIQRVVQQQRVPVQQQQQPQRRIQVIQQQRPIAPKPQRILNFTLNRNDQRDVPIPVVLPPKVYGNTSTPPPRTTFHPESPPKPIQSAYRQKGLLTLNGTIKRPIQPARVPEPPSAPILKKRVETNTIIIPKEYTTSNTDETQRNQIPLVHLANSLKDITLPNRNWTCKVYLKKVPDADQNVRDKICFNGNREYTPAIVSFRYLNKSSAAGAVNREITFRNDSYKVLIQGREIRMIGAPNVVKNFKDIESLVDCVDFINLNCKDVVELVH